jgi:hypothetical protein
MKFIIIPSYNIFTQDIYITVNSEPLMHQRIPLCKSCWHEWHDIQMRIGKQFIGRDLIQCRKKEIKHGSN